MVESDYKMKSIEKRFLIYKKELKKKGISSFVKNRAQRIKDEFLYLSVRYLRPEKYFTYNGKKYQYLISRYNYSWKNERTVEVPLIYYHVLKVKKNKNILEIGNVLSHYYKIDHDIVDKYEKAPGVINEDVVKFKSNKKYDLIIAISTLEHVGWDERPQEPKKITPTLRHLRTLLKKDGKYYWDWKAKYAKGGGVGKTYFLFKIKDVNDWDVWQLLRDNSVDSKVMYNGLIVDGYDKKSFRVEKTIKLLDEKGYDYTVKEMQYLAKGGSVDKRDSWHSDRRQFNKSEDWEKPMSQRKNRYDNGGGVGSTQMKYPKHSYDYGGTTMTDENTVRQNLHNGEIHSDILAEIIGRKPNYPNEIVGSIKLEKCFMKPYYRID